MIDACCEARPDLAEPDERDETADWTEPGRRSAMVELSARARGEREAEDGGEADERELAAETTDILERWADEQLDQDTQRPSSRATSAIEACRRSKGHAAFETHRSNTRRVDRQADRARALR